MFLDIFALVTGLIFMVLQIKQSKWMWPVEIVACTPLIIVFIQGHAWGSAALQVYYLVMAFVGLFTWRKAAEKVDEGVVHLSRPGRTTAIVSLLATAAGWIAVAYFFSRSGDVSPILDAGVLVLGVVGTWWLTRSYLEQWFIWVVADTLQIVVCIILGKYAMALLYVAYVASSVIGYIHWKKLGEYVD